MNLLKRLYSARKQREYKGGRPGTTARLQNRMWSWIFGAGIMGPRAAVLEVIGRSSGRPVSLPVAVVTLDGERYLVSMLGADANWVRNIEAADGKATLRHGRTESVILVPDLSDKRAEILRRYVSIAPGARPHVPVDRREPIENFQKVVDQFPVFRITINPAGTPASH